MKIILSMPVFGKNLQYLRRKRGLTRFALARRVGLRWRDICALEKPNWPARGIDMESSAFFRIGEVLGVDTNLMSAVDMSKETSPQSDGIEGVSVK